jgi:hypothetical protein
VESAITYGIRAKDRLRLFRFPLTRDTLPLLASTPIRVNSTGGILTLLLIRLRGTEHSFRCAALPFETCSLLTTRQYQLLREIVRRIEVASRPSPLGSTHLPISLWSPISDPSKNECISLPQAPEKHTHSLTVDPVPIQNEYQIYPSYQGSLVKI